MINITRSLFLTIASCLIPLSAQAKKDLPIYVATGAGTILAYTAPGIYTTFATGLSSPAGIAVDRKGNVYVSESAAPNRILKFTAPGVYTVLGTLPYATGLALDGCGNLYAVGSGASGSVIVYSSNGGVPKVFASGLYAPVHVAIDGDQNVFVTLAGTYPNGLDGGILKFTAPDTYSVYATGLNNARSISVDSENRVYIVENNSSGRILQYTGPNTSAIYAQAINFPYALSVDEEDVVWASDTTRIFYYTSSQSPVPFDSGLFYPSAIGFRVDLKSSKECRDR